MDIQINEIEYCKLFVKCELDKEVINSKKTEIINKFKEHKIPGFREGKASVEVVKTHFRKEIQEVLKQELFEEAFHNTVFEKKIKPFGYPQLSKSVLESGKFLCEFTMHMQPEVELKQYKGLEIPNPGQLLSTEELSQRMLQDLRMRQGNTNPFTENDFVEMNDNVIVNYKCSIDEEELKELETSGELLTVGKTSIPGFDENLLGMKLGEERKFTVFVPKSNVESLSEKDVTFDVALVMGSKVIPAALDDDFAKKVGFDNFDALNSHVVATASTRVQELKDEYSFNQVSRRLVNSHEFKVPDWITLAEAQFAVKSNKLEWDSISDEEKEKFLQRANDSIKLSLILDKIRENEPETQLSDEEVFDITKKNITKFSQNPEETMKNIFGSGQLPIIFSRIRDDFTLQFIVKNSTILE